MMLRDKGRPNFKSYYSKVAAVQPAGDRAVRFDLGGAGDRELPLILGFVLTSKPEMGGTASDLPTIHPKTSLGLPTTPVEALQGPVWVHPCPEPCPGA